MIKFDINEEIRKHKEILIKSRKVVDDRKFLVHRSDWSGQPDIHIVCDDSWTTPTWDKKYTNLPEHIYEEDGGRLYTFESILVTCKECLK